MDQKKHHTSAFLMEGTLYFESYKCIKEIKLEQANKQTHSLGKISNMSNLHVYVETASSLDMPLCMVSLTQYFC